MLVPVLIFAVALGLIASEKVDRTKVSVLGGVLVLLTFSLEQDEAFAAIDFNTIGLLAGMMVMVHLTERTGVYTYLAIRAGQLSGGGPLGVILALGATTAVLSAFLDNLTTILLVVPITFVLADALDIDPIPLVIMEIIASNIGGTATLIGDPPNIIIAGATDLSFGAFILNLAPPVVIAFLLVIAVLHVLYRNRLRATPEARERIQTLVAVRAIEDRPEALRTVPILVGTILLFFVHKPLHLEPATCALAGAALMLLLTKVPVEEALSKIEWPTLFFFMGLFVMVGALEESGAIKEVADGIASVTGGNRTAELMGIMWSSAFGSAVVDNIPFTTTMIPVVEQLQGEATDDDAYWWALSLGACFGGNATIVAAAANVAGSGLAARAGRPIGFVEFMKVGIPVTLLSLAVATAYVALRYL